VLFGVVGIVVTCSRCYIVDMYYVVACLVVVVGIVDYCAPDIEAAVCYISYTVVVLVMLLFEHVGVFGVIAIICSAVVIVAVTVTIVVIFAVVDVVVDVVIVYVHCVVGVDVVVIFCWLLCC